MKLLTCTKCGENFKSMFDIKPRWCIKCKNDWELSEEAAKKIVVENMKRHAEILEEWEMYHYNSLN